MYNKEAGKWNMHNRIAKDYNIGQKDFTANLKRRHDLPTPESPMSKSLKR